MVTRSYFIRTKCLKHVDLYIEHRVPTCVEQPDTTYVDDPTVQTSVDNRDRPPGSLSLGQHGFIPHVGV